MVGVGQVYLDVGAEAQRSRGDGDVHPQVLGSGTVRSRSRSDDGEAGACTTPPEITTGAHWLGGTTTTVPLQDVLGYLQDRLQADVVTLPRGMQGYTLAYLVGPVRVMGHPERPEVFVQWNGTACEELGSGEVAYQGMALDVRASRFDIAWDGCGFTPAEVRDAWRAGGVRTRVKVRDEAREDRQWRRCGWGEEDDGDVFRMGSRSSRKYARCYDRRGFTRLELELKREAAALAGRELLPLLAEGDLSGFMEAATGWLRSFVDFVQDDDENVSRRSLAPWWAVFVAGAEKCQTVLGVGIPRTLQEVKEWVRRQVAPSLGLLQRTYGLGVLAELAEEGVGRWRSHHRAVMRRTVLG
jgi:hypothetical protein